MDFEPKFIFDKIKVSTITEGGGGIGGTFVVASALVD